MRVTELISVRSIDGALLARKLHTVFVPQSGNPLERVEVVATMVERDFGYSRGAAREVQLRRFKGWCHCHSRWNARRVSPSATITPMVTSAPDSKSINSITMPSVLPLAKWM